MNVNISPRHDLASVIVQAESPHCGCSPAAAQFETWCRSEQAGTQVFACLLAAPSEAQKPSFLEEVWARLLRL